MLNKLIFLKNFPRKFLQFMISWHLIHLYWNKLNQSLVPRHFQSQTLKTYWNIQHNDVFEIQRILILCSNLENGKNKFSISLILFFSNLPLLSPCGYTISLVLRFIRIQIWSCLLYFNVKHVWQYKLGFISVNIIIPIF